jgi:hypothetical protein
MNFATNQPDIVIFKNFGILIPSGPGYLPAMEPAPPDSGVPGERLRPHGHTSLVADTLPLSKLLKNIN